MKKLEVEQLFKAFKKSPYLALDIQLRAHSLKKCFTKFLEKDSSYKQRFLQKEFGYGFDGYSYPGQLDSINQAYDDRLHSFVFSDDFTMDKYPIEFRSFLTFDFIEIKNKLLDSIKNILGTQSKEVLTEHFSFSVSANFYPASIAANSTFHRTQRLTEHLDGSLITFFPFGLDDQLQYQQDSKWVDWPASKSAICFPGYLMELITEGAIRGLNHRVLLPEGNIDDRFSFAFFLVPKKESSISFVENEKKYSISPIEYYQKYLALFED